MSDKTGFIRSGGSIAWRFFNPGNLRGSDLQCTTIKTKPNGNFAVFPDAETGKQMGILEGAVHPIVKILFTNDDKLLIAKSGDYSNEDFTILAWNVEDYHLISKFHIPGSNDMAIDKDGKRLGLAVYSRFSFIVYDIKEGRIIKELYNAHSESLSSIDFSPDGKKILTAAYDGKFKVWDWENGNVELSVKGLRQRHF